MNREEIVLKGLDLLTDEFGRFTKSSTDAMSSDRLRVAIRDYAAFVLELEPSKTMTLRKIVLDAPPGLETEMKELQQALRSRGFSVM